MFSLLHKFFATFSLKEIEDIDLDAKIYWLSKQPLSMKIGMHAYSNLFKIAVTLLEVMEDHHLGLFHSFTTKKD